MRSQSHKQDSRFGAHVPLFVSLVLLTASVHAKFVIPKPKSTWVSIAKQIVGGAIADEGVVPSSSANPFADEEEEEDDNGDAASSAAAAAAAAEQPSKFQQAAASLRAHGHPSDCAALAAFEAAVADGADTPEPKILELWLDLRIAMCGPVKNNATVYERNLNMVAMEAEAYKEGGRIDAQMVDRLHAKLAKELGVREGKFKASLAAFEETMRTEVNEAGQQIVGAMLNVLRDPDFAAKAQKSMDERESRAREFLSTAEAIDETRKQFLEALEGAAEQSPLVATQMAMKMKPTLEVLLGPGAV